ncbi:hypothetical protein F4818DRAFT_438094 [Hypoxylon cercidicola]|nr:hypothetical protein F4818DRAFT_438094 [Hypoxylon cercidicola]
MPPTSEYPPPIDPDNPGRGPMVIGVTWLFMIISGLVVALRLRLRQKVKLGWGWDDWLMLLAVVFRLSSQILITFSYHYGLGKHDRSLTYDQLVFILRGNWVTTALSVPTAYLARVSIAILLVRLFGVHRWLRWYLIVTTTLLGVSSILYVVVTFLQASPVEALWDILRADARRWDPRVWLGAALLYQVLSTIADLTYALFPVIIIWKLNMPLGRRIALILLMGMSLVTMSLSIVLAVELPLAAFASQASVDVQYGAASTLMYGGLEQSFVIIMGCVPPIYSTLKPHLASFKNLIISSFTRKDKNRSTTFDQNYSSSGAYQNLELSTTRLGNVDSRRTECHATVTCPPRGESDDSSTDINHVRRTDEFALSYK